MKYLVMWLITVMASFGMELSNELRYLKDVADNGYKIDINKLKELNEDTVDILDCISAEINHTYKTILNDCTLDIYDSKAFKILDLKME